MGEKRRVIVALLLLVDASPRRAGEFFVVVVVAADSLLFIVASLDEEARITQSVDVVSLTRVFGRKHRTASKIAIPFDPPPGPRPSSWTRSTRSPGNRSRERDREPLPDAGLSSQRYTSPWEIER